ncbi:MAG: redoxin family protein, partial [Aeromonas sp.]
MNKKRWLFLIPFMVFLLGSVFLFKGLYSDPTRLESVMVGQPVPVFTLQDMYDLNKQHDRTILMGRPMLLNVWATWCPTCYGEHTYL